MEIDSRMIIGILLCGIEDYVSSLSRLEESEHTNLIYNIFTRDNVFKKEDLKSFLKNCDRKLLKKLFLTSVVEFKDSEFLDLNDIVTYNDIIIHRLIINSTNNCERYYYLTGINNS